ncbi:hypothetical protein [Nonomuraea sp. NPDC049480]|uniref:hypothetical protein n=1 Tax=Nonomuraea sp. NPDC049480 TaxID=3364353 RepID=UPI0037BB1B54
MIFLRVASLLLAAGLLGAGTAAPAQASQAAPARSVAIATAQASSPITVDCGWVTCSLYFSRGLTRRMVTPTGAAAVISGTCGHPACRVITIGAGLIAVKAAEAAGKRQCLRIRFVPSTPPVFAGLYSSGNGHCRGR